MTLPTAQEIASEFLFGSSTPPLNFDDPLLIRSEGATSSIPINTAEFMDSVTGPGRFALGSEFQIVQSFFDFQDMIMSRFAYGQFDQYIDPISGDVRMTKIQFAQDVLGLGDYGLNVANRSISDGYDDYTERTFVWGGTQFKLGDVEFVFTPEGQFSIENYSVVPRHPTDNFDFAGSDWFTNLGNVALEHAMDPSGIGRKVNLVFDDYSPAIQTYTFADYQADQDTADTWQLVPSFAQVDAMNDLMADLFDEGITATIVDGRPVIYGTSNADAILEGTDIIGRYDVADSSHSLFPFGSIDLPVSDFVDNGIIYITGGGDDYIQGTNFDDDFQTGIGQDIIEANAGNDWIDGGDGGDTIDGGAGTDVLYFDKTGAGVTVNLAAGTGLGGDAEGDTYSNIEVVIGTDNVDTFNSQLGSGHRFAGGIGNDVFDLSQHDALENANRVGPVIVWGGEGADTYKLDGYSNYFVVDAEISELGFAQMSLDDLGYDIDWSKIDLVIINPDTDDEIVQVFEVFDEDGNVTGTEEFTLNVSNDSVPDHFFPEYDPYLDYLRYYMPDEGIGTTPQESFVWTQASTFLGSEEMQIQANWASWDGYPYPEYLRDIDVDEWPMGWAMAGGNMDGTIIVSTGRRVHLGTDGDDTQSGDGRSESFAGSLGADTMDGGGGTDKAYYKTSAEAVDVNLASGSGAGGDAEGDTYSSIENVTGSDFNDTITGDASANVLNGGAGNDQLTGGAGDDTFVYTSGNDTIAGNGQNHGNDTLDLSQYTAAQVSFVVEGNDVVITTPDGSIRLEDEVLRTSGHYHSNIENVIFSDGTLDEQGLRDRAINDQNTAGDDTIVMGGGSDTFDYLGGNDTIAGNGQNHGVDTLDLSQYTAAQVSFLNVGNNVEITTPDGVIELTHQILRDTGHYHANIEHVIFSDGSLDEAGIRARAVSDQSSTGDDVIVATQFDDILNGGAGNDILTGGSGADIIELDFGSGSDTMTDFEDGIDIIDLSATGLVFGDLTISANGSGDAVISFDDGNGATALDELTLLGITTDKLTAEDFQFG